MNRCDHCGAETTNGLALCEQCRYWLLINLEFIPIYFHNLARWRPSPTGVRRVPESREPFTPAAGGTDRIGRILDESHADLTGWARTLADDRPQLAAVVARILRMDEEPSVRLICALLTKRVDTLTTLPWIRDLVVGVAHTERRLRNETERAVPGWYAGACRRCSIPTYVVPGLTWVTCQGCGTTTHAAAQLDVILAEARGWVARPRRIAEVIVALIDTEQSVPRLYERIRKWEQREKIIPIRGIERGYAWSETDGRMIVADLEVGHARYRFGEVLDVLRAEGATRATTSAVACVAS